MVACWQGLGERLHEFRHNKGIERERPWSVAPWKSLHGPQFGNPGIRDSDHWRFMNAVCLAPPTSAKALKFDLVTRYTYPLIGQ